MSSKSKNTKYYMVAPFLGPLRKWIKKNRPKPKKSQEAADGIKGQADTDPLQVSTGPVAVDPAVADASSQALKLLLGIADAPVESGEWPTEPSRDHPKGGERDSDHIDLASLFQKPSGQQTRDPAQETTKPFNTQSTTVPINILNTSIEASILDQLRPARSRVDGAPPQDHVQAFRREQASYHQPSPVMSHQQLPPWMSQQQFMAPTMLGPGPPPHMHPRHDRPLPPPNLYSMHPPAGPSIGPPGFGPATLATSPSRKVNPNARSLLALLKPGETSSQPQQQTGSALPRPGPPGGGASLPRIPLVGPPRTSDAPVAHKQSLLALLRPAGQAPPSQGQGHPVVAEGQGNSELTARQANPPQMQLPSAPQISSREAFLMDYLTQAANSIR